jgi:hypothetical protein
MSRREREKTNEILGRPIDTRRGCWVEPARHLRETVAWLGEVAQLYGRRRVERELRGYDDETGPAFLAYWRASRRGAAPRLVPASLLIDPEEPVIQLALRLVLARRQS